MTDQLISDWLSLPDCEAFRQGQTEDQASQDTQHRAGPADEERAAQLKPAQGPQPNASSR